MAVCALLRHTLQDSVARLAEKKEKKDKRSEECGVRVCVPQALRVDHDSRRDPVGNSDSRDRDSGNICMYR
jgi:hypothetical protein